MKVADLFEAKYQDTNELTLDGWLVAGKKHDRITITIGDCVASGDKSMCKIVDWESGMLAHIYKDALEPGTEVEFGQVTSPERVWYIMPTTDNPVAGWFIRGPNLLVHSWTKSFYS